MSERRLRPWGGTFAMSLAFPVAALMAAVLVFATTPLEPGLVVALVAALVPWALVAGDVRVGPWAMVLAGVGIPGVVVGVYDAPGAIFLALLAVAWVAARGESLAAEITALVGGAILLPVMFAAGDWDEDGEAFVFFATGGLIMWCIGRILRRERQLVSALTEAQDRLQQAASAAERQRIARDVHDVVGHSLTVMLLNVTGARRVMSQDPAAAAQALDRAEDAGRGSLQSVRAIVGLLRTSDDPDDPADAHGPGESGARSAQPPRPGAADIVGLVQTAAAAGLGVRADVAGDLEAVDPYAGLAAYRLVQEAITNAERHAPGSDVVVRVVRDADRLAVSVRNGPSDHGPRRVPGPGGTGLDGMRQRVGALGGTLSAGPDGDGWAVEGSIPLRRDDVAARPDARVDAPHDTGPEERPEAGRDVGPEVRPEAARDVGPEVRPEAGRDVGPEVRPEAGREVGPDRPGVRPEVRR
jgi:signal transduction histidine kinase